MVLQLQDHFTLGCLVLIEDHFIEDHFSCAPPFLPVLSLWFRRSRWENPGERALHALRLMHHMRADQ